MIAPLVAVATITLARTEAEGRLLQRSVARLAAHDWPVVATDGGSADSLISALRGIPGVEVRHGAGLVQQVVTSLQGSIESGAPFILYTEPDKADFFARDLDAFVVRSLDAPARSVCLAARTPASFRTYPEHQQATESAINAKCHARIGVAGDFSYGPFLMPRELAAHLSSMPLHLGWGWRHFAFALAHRLGYGLAMIEGDFVCPIDQRSEDAAERAHRAHQLADNLEGLALGSTISHPGTVS